MKQLTEDNFYDAIVQRDAGSVGERQKMSSTRDKKYHSLQLKIAQNTVRYVKV